MTAGNADTYTVNHSLEGSDWPVSADLVQTGGAIERLPLKFIYVDAGLWAGSNDTQERRRNFAVIYGNWAVTGDFVPSGEGSFQAEGQNRSIYASNVRPE